MPNITEEKPGIPLTKKIGYIYTGVLYTVFLLLAFSFYQDHVRPMNLDIPAVAMDDPQPDRLSMNKLFSRAAGN